MLAPRLSLCFAAFALASTLNAQNPPTAYSITQAVASPPEGSTETISRSGAKALIDVYRAANGSTPASHSLTLFDLDKGLSWAWNPADASAGCSANHFSGDWGDPFAETGDMLASVAKGEMKPAGTETVDGIPAKIYAGAAEGLNIKVWYDEKDKLVLRTLMSQPGEAPHPLTDITKFSLSPPAAGLFVLPAICAGVTAPPTPAEVIADETGDDAANYVNANLGPGSKNSCSIVIRAVKAKTMAPLPNLQVAIDTNYNMDNPPHYDLGVGNDGRLSFAGGGIREITNQVHNGAVRVDNVPPYFMLDVNPIHPGHSNGFGLIYRQCFAPTTVLLTVVKDYDTPKESVATLWVKAGKYADAH